MNRHVVAGVLGLALAGCAQTRPVAPGRGPGLGPVGMTTFPSIHDTINKENPAVDPSSLRAGYNAQGVRPHPTAPSCPDGSCGPKGAMASASAPPAGQAGTAPAAAPAAPRELRLNDPATAAPVVSTASSVAEVPAQVPLEATSPTASASAAAMPPTGESPPSTPPPSGPGEGPAASPGATPPPTALPAAAPETPTSASDPSVSTTGGPALPQLPEVPPAAGAPAAPPAEVPSAIGNPPAPPAEGSAPADPPVASAPPAKAPELPPADSPGKDPSIGVSPDALPPIEPPPGEAPSPPGPSAPSGPAPAPAEPPAQPPAAPLPAPDPSVGSAPDALPPLELPKEPPAQPEPTAPPIPPMVLPTPEEPPKAGGTTPGPATSSRTPARDPRVRVASTDAVMLRSEDRPRDLKEAGKAAAKVGTEVITMHELTSAMKQRLVTMPPGQRPHTDQEVSMLAASVLDLLIEQSVIVQEARHELKNPKQLQVFWDQADKIWREEELDPLLKKTTSTNEYELKQKLKEQGMSLDEMHETFRTNFLAQSYMRAKLGSKMAVSLPEMREYYNEHLKDFDRPAMVSWREIYVDVEKCGGRTQARRKADAILDRLRRGDDFIKVAQVESQGPNRSRGGLWETSPGSYSVDAVNQALDRLPLGQVSQVVEGPSSFHVLRVESRRDAGPASFAEQEVQEKIKHALHALKVRRETTAYVDRLRSRTLITTMFDGTPFDLNQNRPAAN